jgi:AAA family ATP:ADP antiporter
MIAFLRRWLRVEPSEIPLLQSLFCLHFLIVAAFTLSKAARDSLFLENWPATLLPWVHIGVVLWTAVGVFLHHRAVRNRTSRQGLAWSLVLGGLSYLLFFVLPGAVRREMAMLLYFWSASTGLVLVSQFWSLAEESTDARSARRLYSVVSAGGILGGLAGGLVAAGLGRLLGGEGPLLAAGIVSLATVPLAGREVWRAGATVPVKAAPAPGADARDSGGGRIATILRDPYARAMVLLVLLSGMASAVLDYKFKLTIQEMMVGGPKLATFLGEFYSLQSLAALILQLGFGGLLLSKLGARWSCALLPLGILSASGLGFLLPVYPLVAVARLYDAVLRISISATATEFFYFPLPDRFRKKLKLFLDSVVNRGAEALASVLILVAGALLASRPQSLWLVIGLLTVAWLGTLVWMGRLYVIELSRSLRRMVVAPPTSQTMSREARLVSEIQVQLRNPAAEQALYALSLLEETDASLVPEQLPALLKHPAAAVRRRAIELAIKTPEVVDLLDMEELLRDEEESVRVHAALFFSKLTPGSPVDNLREMLEAPDARVRRSALLVVVEHSEPGEAAQVLRVVDEFLARGEPGDRLAVAQAIALARGPAGIEKSLAAFLADPDRAVRQAAMEAAGKLARRSDVPLLIERLADRHDRPAARAALAAYGDRVIGTLGDYLVDTGVPVELQRQIPRVLAMIGSQEAVNSLLRAPLHHDRHLDYQVLKALNRIRAARRPVLFPAEQVSAQIRSEAFDVTRLLVYRRTFEPAPGGPAHGLLLRALDERFEHGLDRLFRRLALLYPPREIHLAYLGIRSDALRTRAQSVEYLASVLAPEDRMAVLPLVDLLPDDERVNNASAFFRFGPRTAQQALEELAAGTDPWLVACALFVIGETRLVDMAHLVRRAVESLEPLVQDTARWAAKRLA